MKINTNTKYVFYIILFIIFVLIRINNVLLSGEIEDISFKTLAISSCAWPFGIIKETALSDNFLPIYYLFIGIFKNEIVLKIINSIMSFLTILVVINIGKKVFNEKMGLCLGFFLAINHFFLYYTNLIAPYCLIFLIQALTINCILDYLKKPSKTNFKKLNTLNILLIICDTFGFLYVLCEIFIFNLLGKKKKIYKNLNSKLFNHSFMAFLIIFPICAIQYINYAKLVIPQTYDDIGLNLNSLYLMLSEYISPFLSFNAPQIQTKSTLGLLYSYFINPDIKNINSLKILIVLFYSSILPLILIFLVSLKAYLKNVKLRLIFLISITNFSIILFLILIEKIELQPIYAIQFFITSLILLGYGIFTIKDNFIKYLLITCLFGIQLINPELNCFNITLNKHYAVINPINVFIKEYDINKKDLILMPYMGHYGKMYYKDLSFFDFDYKYLQTSKKDGFIKNLSNKKANTVNKKNLHRLMVDYLLEERLNSYITAYFVNNCLEKYSQEDKRIVLIIDKLNSKPISQKTITKYLNAESYSPHARKIDFRYADLTSNQSKILFDSIKSKTLYNFANLLNANFRLKSIAEYKKIDNEYYRIQSSSNIYRAISSYESDYAFIVFENK